MKKIKIIIGFSLLISVCTFSFVFAFNQKKFPGYTVGYRIYADDEYAYVSHNDGVEIIDIENKRHPKILENIEFGDGAFGIEKQGDLLYIAGWSEGLIIANVSNPKQPSICSKTPFEGAANMLTYHNDLVYILLSSNVVKIMNVSNPYSPVLLPTFTTSQARDYRDIKVAEDVIFIADVQRGIDIINASNPSSPVLLNTIKTSAPIALHIYETNLFLGCHGVGVKWYDISNLTSPILKGTYQEPGGEVYGVWGNVTHLYVADLQRGTYCLVTLGGRLSKINHYEGAAPHDISGSGETIYLADQDLRLMIFDANLNCLYDGHKKSYWFPIGLTIIPVSLIVWMRGKVKKNSPI
ncbi:hypothetical protein NEF87_002367 [Candidatus Lokiarchaeum ossiferum]|uniref:YncE family protein n=1 Tax=Candidatus Lokiarchaeum ossiferum TaxID=2951803 RepID=A0ABY6HRE0_9ARCH|nr:hypothetical protein NEF87_002367 [Candidatus Lokiarchaeum sp. B-35]